uniref:Flavin prenyltransferase UbiX n=1 Tax=Candidatus Kentrum sp. TUN TaxID=2126343 RepID=A0A451AD75_9GAMM|nr:MAG: 4-hydroxy-3-polyprenylbenzoate decarboxylase [Candidatus Kentron sp. TUN]VFK63979.1 MAG: 4-hydroxy-3-polyprenylbenzoate decarboxylase [Candidatus Kentron sp. TUN]VFK69550.1 MAG: 4-hydroxy-3-polyprenylbenzoate decarboxylase [Candidatus Kentron sp. TUN]
MIPLNSTIALAITGASGASYGLRLLEMLLHAERSVSLLISDPAKINIEIETGLVLPDHPEEVRTILTDRYNTRPKQLTVFGLNEWTAPMASGSNAPHSFVICPCSSGTLSAVAAGASGSLLERAADVVLKERRQLILVTREMPLSTIHLENMLKLAHLGVIIMPASPGFYHRPQTVGELVDFVVARILDHLGIEHTLVPRWKE